MYSPAATLALQRGFALVCHQQPERSFFLLGGSAAVCARCLGIYLGAAMGSLLRMPRQLAKRFLCLALALNAADWFAEIGGLYSNWIHVRFLLGIVLGTAAAILIAASTTRARPVSATSQRSGLIQHAQF